MLYVQFVQYFVSMVFNTSWLSTVRESALLNSALSLKFEHENIIIFQIIKYAEY